MYKNMKIAITDEVQLKAVCDVLQSMGYVKAGPGPAQGKHIITCDAGLYMAVDKLTGLKGLTPKNLTDLLSLRDKKFKEKIHA